MPTPTTEASIFDLTLLRCAAGTDVGMRRDENQDSFGVIKQDAFHAYFVADGMGGAQGGATASRMTIALLSEAFNNSTVRVTGDFIISAVENVNRRIYERGSQDPACAGMGTTLVGLVFTPEALLGVNVGDSRAYRIRGDSIVQISEDHTLVKELVQSGAIAPEDVHQHPISHMLTRSLGPLPEVTVECRVLPEVPQLGDVYILCSDGLYNYVPPEDILAVIRQNPIDDANQILINLANQRGGSDNITALVIAVGDKPPRGRKNSMFPANITSDSDATRSSPITPADTTAIEQPVIPPPVKEPPNSKSERKISRERNRTSVRGPRPLPTAIVLGSTLVIGLVLGTFVRHIPSVIFNRSDSAQHASDIQEESLLHTNDEASDRSPLATLAKQIAGERDDSGGSQSGSTTAPRRVVAQLEQSVQRLETSLRALEQPADAGQPQALDRARAELTRLERAYQAIEAKLDVASRSVTLWLGRQVAFEGQETSLDSLSEMARVGTYSPVVKEKLALITSLSYQYREKADEVELHPADVQLKAELADIEQRRDRLRAQLADDIYQAIKSSLAKSYKDYETLKAQRDTSWIDLQAAKRDVDLQTSLRDNDPTRREALKQNLLERLESDRKALAEARSAGRSGRAQ